MLPESISETYITFLKVEIILNVYRQILHQGETKRNEGGGR